MVVASALAAALLLAFVAAAESQGAACSTDPKQVVSTGIVKATGCWTQSTNSNGDTIFTAGFDSNPEGIDLNGFIVAGDSGKAIQINTTTREVKSIAVATGDVDVVQLLSRNWPVQGDTFRLGDPIKIDFAAPENSDLLLEDLHLGSNAVLNAFAGLSPVGTVETPIRLKPGGGGSMDLTIALSGIFTLYGRAQSATINLPTKPGEGTSFDGFELKLKRVDSIKGFPLSDLEAKYSKSKNSFGGSATVQPPMFDKGVGLGFKIENGMLTEAKAGVHGIKIPIFGAGFLTDLEGGFNFLGVKPLDFNGYCKSQGYEGAVIVGADKGPDAFTHWKCHKGNQNDGIDVDKACKWQSGNPSAYARYSDPNNANSWKCVGVGISGDFDLVATADLGATIGPALPSPFGDIAPVAVNSTFKAGYQNEGFFFSLNGGVKFFRLPVGDAHVLFYSNGGIDAGIGLGLGLPSFKNNENDPFYIGGLVDGWFSKGHYQLEGKGRVALFGARILDGQFLINDRVIGSCWRVLAVPGGAAFVYGHSDVKTFGIGCGLDDYREKFPAGASASARHPQTFRLTPERKVLAVKGDGAAPRFTLRSKDGRVYRTPTDKLGVIGDDHAFFINDGTETTNVVLPHPRGSWTITPDPGSVQITSVRAAREAPKEHVTASVRGHGIHRTLVWRSRNRAHTRLVFTEMMGNGLEIPILTTGKANGRHHFTAATHGYYGKRKLRVVIVHGYGSRQHGVVDRYHVHRPKLLPAPRRVKGWRDEHTVHVTWSGVRGAHGYLIQVAMRRRNSLLTSYVRQVPARRRSVVVPHHPGGGTAEATVFALNVDGRPGVVGKDAFQTNPSVRTLGRAAKLDARSAHLHRAGVGLVTQCPRGGHCHTHLNLLLGGRRIASERFQQTPDTFNRVQLVPNRAIRRALHTRRHALRVVVKVHRTGQHAAARGPVRP